MKYWVIADKHFGHDMMTVKGYRPPLFESMILEQMRQMIKPEDVLIDLGDASFYKHQEWAEALTISVPCRKWLVRGNHDGKSNTWYLSNGWDSVCESMTLKAFGKLILFTHIPATDLHGCNLNIHGHLHSGNHRAECTTTDKHKLVSIEDTFKPVLLRDIVEKW